jgi:hypothetical protein
MPDAAWAVSVHPPSSSRKMGCAPWRTDRATIPPAEQPVDFPAPHSTWALLVLCRRAACRPHLLSNFNSQRAKRSQSNLDKRNLRHRQPQLQPVHQRLSHADTGCSQPQEQLGSSALMWSPLARAFRSKGPPTQAALSFSSRPVTCINSVSSRSGNS